LPLYFGKIIFLLLHFTKDLADTVRLLRSFKVQSGVQQRKHPLDDFHPYVLIVLYHDIWVLAELVVLCLNFSSLIVHLQLEINNVVLAHAYIVIA
jgi:hypothetical protein